MDIIDRYLESVRLLLPRDQRDDIAAELRDVLMSRREEKEAELGRPVTRKEDEALLRAFGHPLLIAARYGRQRYLIGPDLYPIYIVVLPIVLAAVAIAGVVTGVVLGAVSPNNLHHAVAQALDIIWSGGIGSVGVVTIIFAVLQRTGAGDRMLHDWKLDELPRVTAGRRRRHRPGPADYIAGMFFQGLFLLWWTGVLPVWWTTMKVEPHGLLHIGTAQVWHALYLPVVMLSAGVIGVNAARLGGATGRISHALDIALQAATIYVASLALQAGHWVMVSGEDIAPAALAQIDKGVNIGVYVTLVTIVVVAAVSVLIDAWRLWRPATTGAAKPA